MNNNIIHSVNNILSAAIEQNASDIHFEQFAEEMRVRFRIDGILYTTEKISKKYANAIVARLKIMSNLDIAEKRLPQDGKFRFSDKNVDVRVSTCPFIHGEKISLRIFDASKNIIELNQLGMSKIQLESFCCSIKKPQGLILVTGPTGSGKSQTLYSALNYLNTEHKNISSVEDPVEMQLEGINQVQINPKIGLDFSTVLRAFLRQDPDIIMIGEIRDKKTAEIAIRASQTGHLVLSTLHTNSAIESINRLINMGIKHYNLTNSLELIIAQRLVRKLCTACKGKSCDQCKNGYRGRTGIFEVLPLTNSRRELILDHSNLSQLPDQLRKNNITSLYDSGIELTQKNITDNKEITRVLST